MWQNRLPSFALFRWTLIFGSYFHSMHDYWLTIKSDHYLCSSFYFCLIFCCETDSNTVSNCRSLNQMTPPCWYTIFVLDSNDTYPNHWTGTQSIWIGRFHPKLVNPIKGHIEIENTNWGSTPIEGHFTPIWQNWIKVGWEPPIQVVNLGTTLDWWFSVILQHCGSITDHHF